MWSKLLKLGKKTLEKKAKKVAKDAANSVASGNPNTIALVAAGGCFISFFVMIVLVAVIVMAPIMTGISVFSKATQNSPRFFNSIKNFITFNGWCTDSECETKYQSDFEDKIKDAAVKTPSLNISLILSTVFYGQYDNSVILDDSEEPSETDENGNPIKFYKKAARDFDELYDNLKLGEKAYETYVKDTYIQKRLGKNCDGLACTDDEKNKIYSEIKSMSDQVKLLTMIPSNTGSFVSGSCDGVKIKGEAAVYDLEEYVAGVVAAENAGGGPENRKAQAIAARTYVLASTNNCEKEISNSSGAQNFRPTTDSQIISEVEETKGLVLTYNGKIFLPEYDAFCYASIEKDNYVLEYSKLPDGSKNKFTIPSSWVKSNVSTGYFKTCPCNKNDKSMTECWKTNKDGKQVWKDGGHGRGMSQYGSRYLEQQGYNYEQILKFFYSDEVQISKLSNYSNVSTEGTVVMQTSIVGALKKIGMTVDDLDALIKSNVEQAGYGTREAVVAAASTLISTLAEAGYRLPYEWAGTYINSKAVDPIWGTSINNGKGVTYEISDGHFSTYYYQGMDCSGFVMWALYNAGYIELPHSAASQKNYGSGTEHLANGTFIGQPGDLIWHEGHIMMIIGIVDEGYLVAEETGSAGLRVIVRPYNFNAVNNHKNYIVDMTRFYENPNNLR